MCVRTKNSHSVRKWKQQPYELCVYVVTTVNEIKVGELCVLREAFVIWQIVSCINWFQRETEEKYEKKK